MTLTIVLVSSVSIFSFKIPEAGLGQIVARIECISSVSVFAASATDNAESVLFLDNVLKVCTEEKAEYVFGLEEHCDATFH